MITGVVTSSREATLRLTVRGSSTEEREIEAMVDTGFNGFITLSASLVAALGLPYHSHTVATLADGRSAPLRIYKATVDWNGTWRNVFVLQVDGGPLVGMSLLYGSRMTLDVVEGGLVMIEAIPR